MFSKVDTLARLVVRSLPTPRYQRGEISQRPGYTGNPFRPR